MFETFDSYFFVFCIFEKLHSYLILFFLKVFFVFLQQIQVKYKNTLCIFVFFVFSITSKYSLCIFVFFHSFTDCTLSFCILRSLDMPSKSKTANPPVYVVFSFC